MRGAGFKEFFELFERLLDAERFNSINSPVHRLDPRVKILASTAIILSAIAVDGFFYLIPLAFAVLFLLSISRLPRAVFLSRSLPFTLLSALVVLPAPFVTPGVPAATIHLPLVTVTPTFEGVYRAVTFVFRVWICISSALLLTFTTRFPDIAAGLRGMGFPSLLSLILLLTYRYSFLFADEALKMLQAKESRTLKKEGFFERVRLVGKMTGCLLLRAYEKGEEVYYAMSLRGFHGELAPTVSKLKLRACDVAFAVAFTAFCLTVALLGWGGPSFVAFWLPLAKIIVVKALLRWVVLIIPLSGGFAVA
ncbi:MAG: cobalt ECF transporter T component CbiQ [Candidatus Jordarchaeales archaeon]